MTSVLETSVGISMASLPGRTVWQKETTLPHLFVAWRAPVPSTQYGESGNGFLGTPPSQYRPPFCASQFGACEQLVLGALTMDCG